MTNKELYQSTFSQVHYTRSVEWEIFAEKKAARKKCRPARTLVVLAAVVGLLAILSTAVLAGNWLGLRELLVPGQTELPAQDQRVGQSVDMIGLQGFAGSAESRALGEWQSFLDGYDRDHKLLEQVGNGPTGLEERYALYSVYTREMADRLDEITQKYGLMLHKEIVDVDSREDLLYLAGGDFLGTQNAPYSTYLYEDGTFHFDGEAELIGYGLVDYQFMRCVKGSFTEVLLNIGDVRTYQEWSYTTGSVLTTLALGSNKGLLIADLGDSFVTVNVLAGKDPSCGGLTKETLEALADSFDLAVLTPVRKLDDAGTFVDYEAGMQETSLFYQRTGVREAVAETFFKKLVEAVENDDRETVLELVAYPRLLNVSEGTATVFSAEELLPYYDALFTESLKQQMRDWLFKETLAENGMALDLITRNGMIGGAGGALWFACDEGGELRIQTIQNEEGGASGMTEMPA